MSGNGIPGIPAFLYGLLREEDLTEKFPVD